MHKHDWRYGETEYTVKKRRLIRSCDGCQHSEYFYCIRIWGLYIGIYW